MNFNQDYNYLFKYSGMLDAVVVSTWQQKEDLEDKLREYGCTVPRIVVNFPDILVSHEPNIGLGLMFFYQSPHRSHVFLVPPAIDVQ